MKLLDTPLLFKAERANAFVAAAVSGLAAILAGCTDVSLQVLSLYGLCLEGAHKACCACPFDMPNRPWNASEMGTYKIAVVSPRIGCQGQGADQYRDPSKLIWICESNAAHAIAGPMARALLLLFSATLSSLRYEYGVS